MTNEINSSDDFTFQNIFLVLSYGINVKRGELKDN